MVFALALAPLLVGGVLTVVRPSDTVAPDIGTSLIGGAIIGLVFALVQYTMDQRNQAQDKDLDLRLLLTSSSDLPGIDLSRRTLGGVYLQGKKLQSARLDGTDLSGATLDAAMLEDATLSSAILDRATLRGVRAQRARLARSSLVAADLTGADLSGADMQAAVLDGADLSGAMLIDADLSRASLAGTVLDRAQLDDARLCHARGKAARLARTRLSRAMLQFVDLTGAQLARADLAGARLLGANLTAAVLIRADLSGVVATGCSLAAADLSGCRLTDADLRLANLTGALLTGCDLRGADLTGALLDGAQGRDSARSDARTRWPQDAPPDPLGHTVPSGPAIRARVRRLVIMAAHHPAASYAGDVAAEIAAHQVLARANVQAARMSLPLGVRTPRKLSVRVARAAFSFIRRPSTAVVTVDVVGASGVRQLMVTVVARGERVTLPPVPIDGRARVLGNGAPNPTATDEVVARVLDLVDPRDGGPWFARACVMMAIGRWNTEGRAAAGVCRQLLLAARETDPLSPVVNYALGALAYNEYDAASMRGSIEYFAVAHTASARLGPDMEGLTGLCLTGMALSHCQLYHRFGMDTAEVLVAGRSSAAMAVAETRGRLARRGLSGSVRRNATEGYALARYSEAFAHHVTEEEDDVKSSIPIYQDAIDTLRGADVAVPPILYNNLGYQYMTLAGLKERGSDTATYRVARQLFEKAVETFPDLHFAWANLGNVDRLLGNPAAAEKSYRRALDIVARDGGKYPPGWNELACVLLEFGGRDTEAWQAHRQALTDASSPAVRAKLRAEFAQSLVLVGQPEAAVEVAEQGLAEDADNRFCRRALEEARSAS